MDLLFVCRANLCRSPMAERLTRLAGTELSVASAGTHALAGLPMHPDAADALLEAGACPAGFRSRRLNPELLREACLVLTATRAQRMACVTLAPGCLSRTFTIGQFGRLAAAVRPDRLNSGQPARERLSQLVAEAQLVRADVASVGADEEDVSDPASGSLTDMRACLARIARSVRPVLALMDAA